MISNFRQKLNEFSALQNQQQQVQAAALDEVRAKLNAVLDDPTVLHIVYHAAGKDYYMRNDETGCWLPFTREAIRNHLKIAWGLTTTKLPELDASSVDVALKVLEEKCPVIRAMALAGHWEGITRSREGLPVLITSSPHPVPAREGSWAKWSLILHEMLGEEQFAIVWASLALARQNILAHRFGPLRALIFAGEKGCGKTLLQRRLFTPLLGNRVANPYAQMLQNTDFSADIVGSEHLSLDDEVPRSDPRAREALGNAIKKIVATPEHEFHPKFVDKCMVLVNRQITIMVNNSPRGIQMLPIMDEELLEKVCLFRLTKSDKIDYPLTKAETDRFNQELDAELPAVAFALDHYDVDQHRFERYMVESYHDGQLLSHLRDNSTGKELDDLLYFHWYWGNHKPELGLPASEIYTQLYNSKGRCWLEENVADSRDLGVKLSKLAERQLACPGLPWMTLIRKEYDTSTNSGVYYLAQTPEAGRLSR